MRQSPIDLEKQGWQALSSGKEAAQAFYRPLLTDDTVMIFPGGLLLKGKEKILQSMDSQPWKSFLFEETRVISLSENASIVIYKVTARREGNDPYTALISSLYIIREDEWRLALHQQTPI